LYRFSLKIGDFSKGLEALNLARNNRSAGRFLRNFDRFALLRC
jgi:hypothetical protein